MAYRSIRISDLSGKEGADDKMVNIVVRQHPGLQEPVQFDALPEELKGMQVAGDLVQLELRNGAGSTELVVSLEEFNKLAPNMEEVLKNADGLRGRRKGFRPNGD